MMTLSQLLINADPFIKARDTESQRQKGKKIPVSKTRSHDMGHAGTNTQAGISRPETFFSISNSSAVVNVVSLSRKLISLQLFRILSIYLKVTVFDVNHWLTSNIQPSVTVRSSTLSSEP
ncbi:unnamed protein product [Leuciscus chuanchicus]